MMVPTLIESFLTRDNFSTLGTIFSIASFVLSIFVLWNVRKLRNAYRLRARGPSLIRELSKASSNLSKFLNEYDDSLSQVKEELAKAAVKLRRLRRNVNRDQKQSIRRVLQAIDQCEVTVQNEEEGLVYIEIVKVTEELKDYQKDLDWEV
jgi:hypothetical protein